MSVGVKERQVGLVTVLELNGRLTMRAGSDALDEKLQSLIADGRVALLLDCTHLISMDSWGIRALVRGLTGAAKRGGNLKLLKISPHVREVLDCTRLLTVIETFDDQETAVASFASAQPPKAETPPTGAERRRSQRVGLMTQAEALGPGVGSVGRMEDISEGGLLMATPETFEPNTEITVRFNLPPIPPGRPIESQGVVAHAKAGVQMGIQFLLLKDDDRKAIAEFVQKPEE